MRKFIFKTVLLLIPILLTAICMEILLRRIPNDYKYKRDYLDAHSNEIETLILGSSHSFYGIDPNYFSSKTFNASHISQSLDYDFRILMKYQFKFKNLKNIILPISYFTFWEKLGDGPESWRIKNYTIYYGLRTSSSFVDYTEIFSNQFKVNYIRLESYYIKGNSNISCNKLGWGTTYKSEDAKDLIETGKAAALRHTINDINDKKNRLIYNENVSTLQSLILWCRKRRIKLIIFTPPAFETYRNNLNAKQLGVMINTATTFSSNYGNCRYYNFLSDTTFIAHDFFDADHLSEIGAEKLSNMIHVKILEWK
ncbi:MAG: hypothetical protein VB110_10050 [Bacteroidales bacterium]|nr:hypothetical protein [Bacteroidales bacterium]